MTQHQNDLSLLRPFNLEAAKNGEDICWSNISDEVEFIGVSSTRLIAYESDGELGFICQAALRMKPLCWVENRPVYKGDTLYWNKSTSEQGTTFKVVGPMIYDDEILCGDSYFEDGRIFYGVGGDSGVRPSDLTWNKPKQKVKRKVWINVYPDGIHAVYDTKSMADYNCNEEFRIACVETEIEYEV